MSFVQNDKKKNFIAYLVAVFFIAVNLILIIKEFYWFSLLPVALLIIWVYIFSLDKVFLFVALLTPLSINLRDFNIGIGVCLPTEPLLAGILLLFLLKVVYRNQYTLKISIHPISLAIVANLLWMLITALTSELPIISLKFFIARLWFVIPCFFFAVLLFKNKKNISLFLWLYIIGFLAVIVYTLINHAVLGFNGKAAHWVMKPFYNNHTDYGCALALFIPIILGFSFNKRINKDLRFLSFLVFLIFFTALIFSFCRAAWTSLIVAFCVFLIIRFKIKFRWIILSAVIFGGFFYLMQNDIINKMKKNKQDSSAKLMEHVRSISNVSTDASNVERLNRWKCAYKMFRQRPVFGWGPGTYQFLYAPYQLYRDKNIGSTNAGNLGNAHSEYIGPLSDSGVLGSLTFIIIAILVLYRGVMIYKKSSEYEVRILSLSLVLGLITYFTHGFLNNYLDSDKLAVPFWSFIAMIVALDVYHLQTGK